MATTLQDQGCEKGRVYLEPTMGDFIHKVGTLLSLFYREKSESSGKRAQNLSSEALTGISVFPLPSQIAQNDLSYLDDLRLLSCKIRTYIILLDKLY